MNFDAWHRHAYAYAEQGNDRDVAERYADWYAKEYADNDDPPSHPVTFPRWHADHVEGSSYVPMVEKDRREVERERASWSAPRRRR